MDNHQVITAHALARLASGGHAAHGKKLRLKMRLLLNNFNLVNQQTTAPAIK